MKRRTAILVALCMCAGTLAAAPAKKRLGAAEAAGIAMRAAVDGKGNLRQPTATEIDELIAAETKARPSIMRVVSTANGATSIQIDDAYDHALLIRTSAEGALEVICTDDAHDAARFVAAASTQVDSIVRIKPAARRFVEKE